MAQNQQENYWLTLFKSPYRRLGQQLLLGSSILLSGASSITDLIENNDSSCDRPPAVLGLSAASIGLLSVVAFVWMTYLGLRTNLSESRHDDLLLKKFLDAIEEQAQDASKYQSTDPVGKLHIKIQHCLQLFDQLPSDVKQNLPERDLWVVGLLNALPENHPIQQQVLTLSEKLTKSRRGSSKEQKRVSTGLLQEQLENLFKMVEELVGPVKYIAVGHYRITREFQIEEFKFTRTGIQNQSSDGAITIGLDLYADL
jgi:hypothetical protein